MNDSNQGSSIYYMYNRVENETIRGKYDFCNDNFFFFSYRIYIFDISK